MTLARGGTLKNVLAIIALLFATSTFAGTLTIGEVQAELKAVKGDPNVVIDLNRDAVIAALVGRWRSEFAGMFPDSDTPLERASDLLSGWRADQLYVAVMAASFADVTLAASQAPKPQGVHQKALSDVSQDVTYTPLTPCRLIDTRGSFQPVYAGGAFAAGEVRDYTMVGGNGTCLSQLPFGPNPIAVQLQVFAIPTACLSGDLEILPQGSTFGGTATMVFIGTTLFNTVSTIAKVNPATNQISVQIRGGASHLAADLVGYFKAPTLAPVSSLLRSGTFLLASGLSVSSGTLGCPAGQYTISGSCGASSYNMLLSGSYLNVSNGWTCDYNNQSAFTQSITVSAMCIEVPARPF